MVELANSFDHVDHHMLLWIGNIFQIPRLRSGKNCKNNVQGSAYAVVRYGHTVPLSGSSRTLCRWNIQCWSEHGLCNFKFTGSRDLRGLCKAFVHSKVNFFLSFVF